MLCQRNFLEAKIILKSKELNVSTTIWTQNGWPRYSFNPFHPIPDTYFTLESSFSPSWVKLRVRIRNQDRFMIKITYLKNLALSSTYFFPTCVYLVQITKFEAYWRCYNFYIVPILRTFTFPRILFVLSCLFIWTWFIMNHVHMKKHDNTKIPTHIYILHFKFLPVDSCLNVNDLHM